MIRLVNVSEALDVEVVRNGFAKIITLTESGGDYCYHDHVVFCGIDGVAEEQAWRDAFRRILALRADWAEKHGREINACLVPDTDELCQRPPSEIAEMIYRSLVAFGAAHGYVRAVPTDDGEWTYHADETGRDYVVTDADLIALGEDLIVGDPDGIAYSRWCAETDSREVGR